MLMIKNKVMKLMMYDEKLPRLANKGMYLVINPEIKLWVISMTKTITA